MFFITAAYADGAAAAGAPLYMQFVPLVLVGFVMYFLIFRPESKKRKAHEACIASLKSGARVVTSGGILGKIIKVADDAFLVEIDQGTQVHVLKSAIVRVLDQDKTPSAQKLKDSQK